MKEIQKVESITEGKTSVLVLKKKVSKKGPGSKEKGPFYNPAMELNRDLSVLVIQWLVNCSKKHVKLLDGLAASGIRGIRLANEVEGDFDVSINDWDEEAHNLIKKNLESCKLENAVASNKNLSTVLSENCYHYVDIDPFGSPAHFIDSALRGVYNDGIIACTATDTAALCGVYPKVCLRRYGARPFHSPVMHETGLRILLGFICREAGKYDKGIEPLVCYASDHYFRVYFRIRNGIKRADESVGELKCVSSDKLCLSKNSSVNVGPLWMGKLQNKNVVQELRTILFEKQVNTKHELWKLLSLLEDEADAPAFFYTVDSIASSLKRSLPKMKTIFEKLQNQGYNVARTHFSPTGFKTDAPIDEIKKLFK
ncbi:MAG: tRNA (guanine(10)-N(2))-dimethyltransferase [Euryarchaeota archaeon]|nr:tRNA (guanine(10)-N(2))-dimethyltransferase [Euryarchaeota archaeon]